MDLLREHAKLYTECPWCLAFTYQGIGANRDLLEVIRAGLSEGFFILLKGFPLPENGKPKWTMQSIEDHFLLKPDKPVIALGEFFFSLTFPVYSVAHAPSPDAEARTNNAAEYPLPAWSKKVKRAKKAKKAAKEEADEKAAEAVKVANKAHKNWQKRHERLSTPYAKRKDTAAHNAELRAQDEKAEHDKWVAYKARGDLPPVVDDGFALPRVQIATEWFKDNECLDIDITREVYHVDTDIGTFVAYSKDPRFIRAILDCRTPIAYATTLLV